MTYQIDFIKLATIFFLALSINFTSCSSGEGDEDEFHQDDLDMQEDDNDDDNLEIAPNFTLDTYDGNKISSDDIMDKVAVIFFFGEGCGPCISIAPDIESQLNQGFNGDAKFTMLGINTWNGNSASVENFKNKTGVTFPLGIKGSGVASDFGTTYDRLVVINTKGKIAFRGGRVAANDLDEVVSLVTGLLN